MAYLVRSPEVGNDGLVVGVESLVEVGTLIERIQESGLE